MSLKKILYSISALVASAFLYTSPVRAQEATSYPGPERKIVTFPGDLGQKIDAEENKKYNLGFDENLESLVIWQTHAGYHYAYNLSNVPEPVEGDLTKEEFEEIYSKIGKKLLDAGPKQAVKEEQAYNKGNVPQPIEKDTKEEFDKIYSKIEKISNQALQLRKRATGTNHNNEAEELLLKAIEISPTWALPYDDLGNIYLKRGNNEKALDYFKKSVQLAPQFYSQKLATFLIKNEKVESGIEFFKTQIKKYPKEYGFRIGLAKLYTEKRLLSYAINEYEYLIKIAEEKNLDVWHKIHPNFMISEIYFRLGKYQKAAASLEQCIKLQPECDLYQSRLQRCKNKLSNKTTTKEY